MAGHSKWANIQHRKGRQDSARSKLFTKFAKEITVAAKMGGGDVKMNPRLRLAIDKARSNSMPKDNIERAVKKGTGDLDGVDYIEIRYEGYGPEGVAVIVEALTDNKNRSASSVRSIFSKNGGNLGETGAVGWMFHKKGVFSFLAENTTEEQLMDVALEAGADDIIEEEAGFTVYSDYTDYEAVKEALDAAGVKYEHSEVTQIPENTVEITNEETAAKILKLIDKLESDDDVQDVYSNFDISEELLEKLM